MSQAQRSRVIRRFSPYYNDASSARVVADGQAEIRVLIATDVLAEGLNLQDATRLINDDLHWNPLRLMQRLYNLAAKQVLTDAAAIVRFIRTTPETPTASRN